MPWPWRPPYPDHEVRVAAAQAGADLFNAQDMAAAQSETLEGFRKSLPSDEFEAVAAESAKIDCSSFDFDFLVEDARRTAAPAPLQFIAQIDLADIWATGPVDPDIPREGRLLLFYDTNHRPGGDRPADITGARLMYDLTPVSSLRRASPPAELSAHKRTAGFRPLRCVLHAGMWPPCFGSPEWNACEIKARAEKAVE